MALLRKETCNSRHPLGLCHPVKGLLAVIQAYICILRYGDVYIKVHINKQTNTVPPEIGLAVAWAWFGGGSFSIVKAYMYMGGCLWLVRSIKL